MSNVHAVIIAGGKGERLGGVRKADLRIGGIRLLDRVRQALGEVVEPLMVATGPGAAWQLEPGLSAAPDLDGPAGGPLAGLAAAIAALQARGVRSGLLVTASVDTPFLPADLVPVLREAMGDAAAAYAVWGDDFYPPNAVWRIEALRALPDQVRDGNARLSLKGLLQELGARRVDWRERTEVNPFINLNTLDDLVTLGRMAQKGQPAPHIHRPGN